MEYCQVVRGYHWKSSWRYSDTFHSNQSCCFINLPLVSFINLVVTLRSSPSGIIVYVGSYVKGGSSSALVPHQSLSWLMVSWVRQSHWSKVIPLFMLPCFILGWANKRMQVVTLSWCRVRMMLWTSVIVVTMMSLMEMSQALRSCLCSCGVFAPGVEGTIDPRNTQSPCWMSDKAAALCLLKSNWHKLSSSLKALLYGDGNILIWAMSLGVIL